jgi:hypothetical protein
VLDKPADALVQRRVAQRAVRCNRMFKKAASRQDKNPIVPT